MLWKFLPFVFDRCFSSIIEEKKNVSPDELLKALESVGDISTVEGKRKAFHLWQHLYAFEKPDEYGRRTPFEAPIFTDEEIQKQLEEDALSSSVKKDQYPTVLSHGLGDNCAMGMAQMQKYLEQRMGSYSACISVGENPASQSLDSYFVSLENSLEIWTSKVRADPKLKDGFHAIGTSQGNILIRLYVQKYNDPPVKSWLSIHGIVTGEQGVPGWNPQSGFFNRMLADAAGYGAMISGLQAHFLPFGYFRVPWQAKMDLYQRSSFVAQFNGEDGKPVASKLTQLEKLAMVQADMDSVIFPKEEEHWKMYTDDFQSIVEREDTVFYKEDTFGLRTLHEAGKVSYEHTPGDHCSFSMSQFGKWVTKYLIEE